jgi:small-conductance mechanosensitive channel
LIGTQNLRLNVLGEMMLSRWVSLCGALLLALTLFSSPLHAQIAITGISSGTSETIALPEPLTIEAANALISRLSDTQVRDLLLDQLNAQSVEIADTSDDPSLFFHHATTGAMSQVTQSIKSLPDLLSGQRTALTNFFHKFGTERILQFFGLFAFALGAALVVEFLFRRLTAKWLTLPPPDTTEQSLRKTVNRLSLRLFGELSAVFVFIFVAGRISRQIIPEDLLEYALLIGPYMIAFPRVTLALVRFFMAPRNPEYRIVHATDETARMAVFHTTCFSILIGFIPVILTFNALNDIPYGELRLGFWIDLILNVYLGLMIWKYRDQFVDMMRGANVVTPLEERVAQAFPYFAICVVAALWWIVNIIVSYGNFELLRNGPHYLTMALLLWSPAMDTGIRGFVRLVAPPIRGEGAVAERAHAAAGRSFIRAGRVIVFGIVLIQIAGVWGIDATSIAAAGFGAKIAADVISFLVILSVGYLCYELVSLWINRKLAAEYTASGYDPDNAEFGGDGGGAGGSRLSTVLPLILLVVRCVIVVVFLLIALSDIGVDTTPLLAGAGIVGLAIGFGAQKLVTDVVSGIFFLIDDAFRTGEYVTVEGTMGTVEKISIRSMQLRHHKGPVHTIPYGEIPKVTNFSRDWVIMKLRFTVPFDTDPNKVKKIFKRIGQDLLETEELGADFLQPFKSQGVLEIDDVGMVIRGKFMAKPGKQFMIRKEIFNRVSAAFAENGIDFARREVRVALPDRNRDDALTDEDRETIAAAASQAAQEQADDGVSSKDNR